MIGLGYVGLPLAVEFARAGYATVGIDVDPKRVDRITAGESYIQDVPGSVVCDLVASGKLKATTDYKVLKNIDAVSICVPTPLRKTRDPDIQYIADATAKIRECLHPQMLVTLESTTYPGHHGRNSAVRVPRCRLRSGTGLLSGIFSRAHRSGECSLEHP